jgi:hypothetical protein
MDAPSGKNEIKTDLGRDDAEPISIACHVLFPVLLAGALSQAGPAPGEVCNLSLVTELPLEGNDIGSPIVKIRWAISRAVDYDVH